MIVRLLAAATLSGVLLLSPAAAQSPSAECNQAAPKEAGTPPAKGADSGTAPGGMGSTAWSGGTGGSYVGTNPSGPPPSSPNPQPATASGLDPTKGGPGAKC